MFDSRVLLEELPVPNKWVLGRPLVWRDSKGTITVPAGFITDLASIPKVFRNVLDVNGASRSPATLHDWLYQSKIITRAEADALLRDALAARGVGVVQRNVFYAGVRVGGWKGWKEDGDVDVTDFVDTDSYYNWRFNSAIESDVQLYGHRG